MEIFEHTTNLLTLMRHGGLVMSYAQKTSVESLLKSLSYTYGEILPYVSDSFLNERMNISLMQIRWNRPGEHLFGVHYRELELDYRHVM